MPQQGAAAHSTIEWFTLHPCHAGAITQMGCTWGEAGVERGLITGVSKTPVFQGLHFPES